MTLRTKGQGVAPSHHFLCGLCHKSRSTLGRRMRFVLGLRAFVCAGCVNAGAMRANVGIEPPRSGRLE